MATDHYDHDVDVDHGDGHLFFTEEYLLIQSSAVTRSLLVYTSMTILNELKDVGVDD